NPKPHPLGLLRTRRERECDRRAAECSQQFPPSDGDCHTPLPREVRKSNGTTQRACSLHVQGGHDVVCFHLWSSASRSEAVRLRMRPGGEGKISSASGHARGGAEALLIVQTFLEALLPSAYS